MSMVCWSRGSASRHFTSRLLRVRGTPSTCSLLPGLTHATHFLCQLTRHLEMFLEGRQGLACKGFDISIMPLFGCGGEELDGFLMICDHMMHILAVKTRSLLLGERLCSLLMLFVCLCGYGDVLGPC
jgi:hypothetical protein